jgi:hypothetical protein
MAAITVNYFNYFTEIEDTFIRRRGKHLLLSPIDWAMIDGWQDRGVPLHVVIRGIETVFDGHEKKTQVRTVKGLMFCREEIEAQYQEWLAAQAGKGDDSDEAAESIDRDAVQELIRKAVKALADPREAALAEDYERARLRLEELLANFPADMETCDESLNDIENHLNRALLTKSDEPMRGAIESEVKAQLRTYKTEMPKEDYKRTFELMLLRRLREEYDIPRLSLFYL